VTAFVAILLSAQRLQHSFGARPLFTSVSFTLADGDRVGLIGPNGAGKSTLLKILCGFQPPDSGRIILNGQEVTLKSVDAARALGIDVVYQDLALIDQLTVYHNMFLKREKVRWPLLNNRAMRKIARERLDAIGIGLKSVDVPVARLSGGQRQAIAVARAAAFASKVVILDEPTAALGVRESQRVLELIRRLRDENKAVIVISHAMDHVMEVADRVVVLRRGRKVGELDASPDAQKQIVSLIVGGAD
jgi:simple sugar transport system ATP-binding protein